jgi:hypothetical protein
MRRALIEFLVPALAAAALCIVVRHKPAPAPIRVAISVDCNVPHACELAESLSLDVWSEERGAGLPLDVVVSSDVLPQLSSYQVIVPDIDAVARAEFDRLHSPTAQDGGGDWFADYKDYRAITEKLQHLAAAHPAMVAVQGIGSTLEGRTIWAVRIGNPEHTGTHVLIDGTQHAREWIAAMTTTCIADRLVSGYDTDPAIRDFVDHTELWVVPVVNPDGYQYSWSTDRYWRKNKRDGHGVDLNRNFSVAFDGVGSSRRTSSETYHGPHAFSENESQALRDLTKREHIAMHIDYHAYSQLLLYPWNYTPKAAPDRDKLAAIGDRMASAMFAQHQTRYPLMPGVELYPAAGTMTDWMYGEAQALSYTIELRPRGGRGAGGFVLPPEEIKPTCDEGLAALLAMRAAQ